MALLAYDKRGVGGSSGDWRTAGLEDLAADALAGVQFLRGRKEIDSSKIGLFGASQGGWVAPLAASRSKDIAFVIVASGPAFSPAAVELDRLDKILRARGFREDVARDALTLTRLADDVARGKASWKNYELALEKSRKAEWFRYLYVPLTEDSWLFAHWRRLPLDYDPGPVIAGLRVPVLAMFGGRDQNVLAGKNAEKWREALREGGNRDSRIRVFPEANHMLLESATGAEEELPLLQRFVPEFAPALAGWVRERGILK